MLTWLCRQIPVRWQPSSLLTKRQEYEMTICSDSVDLSGHLRIVDQVASELSRTKTTYLHISDFYVRVFCCFQRNPPESVGGPSTVLSLFPRENLE